MNRVVVTGVGCVSALGQSWQEICMQLKSKQNAIAYMPEWDQYDGLFTRLASPIADFEKPQHYPRKFLRTMGRVSLLAVRATELALQDADIADNPVLHSGDTGIAYGSSTGSTDAITEFAGMIHNKTTETITATSYIRMMGHTAPVNIGVFFGINGRIYTTSSACTSSSQGIGYGYEAIRDGHQRVMICGGAEELCPTEAAVFDKLFATSTRNDDPASTPRPYDKDRDGLVIGEGAATLVLENRDHAIDRGAKIHAELIGFATNSDGKHVTQPDYDSICTVLKKSLENANVSADQVDYVSAHGTATDLGDIAESKAVEAVLGQNVPISALKGYTGHTLGACGAMEVYVLLNMMNDGWFHPNINLDNVDPRCGNINYILGNGLDLDCEIAMSNNFAFGGINTSLIFRRHG